MPDWQAIGFVSDDFRQEVGGTASIIGVHQDHLNVPSVPIGLAKLAFTIRVHVPLSLPAKNISAVLRFPNGTEQSLGTISQKEVENAQVENRKSGLPHVGFVFSAVAANLQMPTEGMSYLMAKYGEEERVCGVMNIRVKPSSIASQQPSSRSGTDAPKTAT